MHAKTTLDVVSLLGWVLVDPGNGAILNEVIRETLDEVKTVTLDFAGATVVTTSFLNSAIGSLYDRSLSEVDERVQVIGLDKADAELVTAVRENAKRFYAERTPSDA